MNIESSLDNTKITLDFGWAPLQKDGQNIYLWELDKKRQGEDLPVFYRFVLIDPKVGKVTIYVGEGKSLNGPQTFNLVYQYGGKAKGRKTREGIKEYIAGQKLQGWTELLSLADKSVIDPSNEQERKCLQELLIGAYYLEHRDLKSKFVAIPRFLNKYR